MLCVSRLAWSIVTSITAGSSILTVVSFFSCNEDNVSIVDVSDKSNVRTLSKVYYNDSAYTHQGWLSEDHNTFVFGDEYDERDLGFNTRTLVLNVADLDNPVFLGSHLSHTTSTDHDQYIFRNFSYQANYKAGLRILKLGEGITTFPDLREVAMFDVYPESDETGYLGAWSVYPFFPSRAVVVSAMDRGLFVLKPDLETDDNPRIDLSKCYSGENRCDQLFNAAKGFMVHYDLEFPVPICLKICVSEAWLSNLLGGSWECGKCS